MSKKLLIETHTVKISPSQLTENVNTESGNLMVEGILATAEVKNGNGRYYSKDLWDREMGKYSELIEQRRSMGELDHPESTVINLKNVSHLISEYWWDGDNKYWWKRIDHSEIETEKQWLNEHIYKNYFKGIVEEIPVTEKYK